MIRTLALVLCFGATAARAGDFPLAGSKILQEMARIWSTRMRTNDQRTHVTIRKTNSALSRNQTGRPR